MAADWKLWEPGPKPHRKPRRKSSRLSQPRLAVELRQTIDAAMIVQPHDIRRNRTAMERLRVLLTRYPDALKSTHVRWNVGQRRLDWLAEAMKSWES